MQHLVAQGYGTLSFGLGRGLAGRLASLHPALEGERDYQAWLESQASRPETRQPSTHRPLVSVLMPVFDAPERFLREAVRSLLEQSYEEWELCAVDAGPAASPGARALAELARGDRRIRVLPVPENLGIAGNSNVALRAAHGAFVATFDQDDRLHPQALAALVARLETQPDLDVVYSDMDNITPWGDRYAPFFKPDWSPELLLSANYLAHFSLIRRSAVEHAGGFDTALNGAQDWDLLLRVTHANARIAHVPEVLYHWRALPTSCASSLDAKPYAREAQRRAVQAQLDRRGVAARAEVATDGTMRLSARDGATEGLGDVVIVADPRLGPQPDETWRELALWASDPAIGAAGALLRRADGRIESAGYVQSESATLSLFAGSAGKRWSPLGWPQWLRNVTEPVPLAFAMRRELHERRGEPGALAGLRCVTVPAATIACPPGVSVDRVKPGGGAGLGFSRNLDPTSPVPRPR